MNIWQCKSHREAREQMLFSNVAVELPQLSLPHQTERTYLAACLKLARPGTAQSHSSPASDPPASWLCFHTPAEPSHSSWVSAWDSKRDIRQDLLINTVSTKALKKSTH